MTKTCLSYVIHWPGSYWTQYNCKWLSEERIQPFLDSLELDGFELQYAAWHKAKKAT